MLCLAIVMAIILRRDAGAKPQGVDAAPRRDPQAIAAIQAAVTALGGLDVIGQVTSVIAMGSLISVAGANAPEGNFIWKDKFNSSSHDFRDFFQSASLSQTFVSGHGNPAILSNGKVRHCYSHVGDFRFAVHLPGPTLARLLANPNAAIEWIGPVVVNGKPAEQIHIHIDSDFISENFSQQDWFLDAATGLPLRVEYRVPGTENAVKFLNAAVELSNYAATNGLAVPHQILTLEDGKPRNILTISSASVNQTVPDSDFDLPAVAQ